MFSACQPAYTFNVLPQRYIHSTALHHNLVGRDLDHVFLPEEVTLAHYVDFIILIGSSGKVATILTY